MATTTTTAKVRVIAQDEAAKRLDRIASAFKTVGVAALGMVAMKKVTGWAKDMTDAADVQTTVENQLAVALANVGKEAEIETMKAYASQLQAVTRQGDEVTLAQMRLGVAMGLTGERLKAAQTAAIGMSKAYDMSAETAMKLIGRANSGDFGGFKRYGIILDENATAQEKFNQVLSIGAGHFPLATAEADSFGGKLTQLANAWGDNKEQIGNWLSQMPGVGGAIDGMITALQNWETTADLAVTNVQLAFAAWYNDMAHFFTVAIPAYWDWFGNNWSKVLTDMANWAKTVFVNIGKNIWNFLQGVWGWLKGDGFSFEWTGLTDGFKATMDELPKIAERALGPLEAELANKSLELSAKLATAQQNRLNSKIDTGELLAKAASEAAGAKIAGIGSSGPAGVSSATESRFMVGRAIKTPTDRNTETLVQLGRQQNQLLTKLTNMRIKTPQTEVVTL